MTDTLSPFNVNESNVYLQGDRMAMFLYDATYTYLTILNDSIAQGKGLPDGRTVLELSRNQSFEGM